MLKATKGRVLKVSKGALIVIKGRLVNGLYLFQDSIAIGTTSISSSYDLDTTCVHHLSEVRIPMLSKHGLPISCEFVMPNLCKHRVCVRSKL